MSLFPAEFTHMEMMKLWKGLYYCMWMSDKPLVQVRDGAEVLVQVGDGVEVLVQVGDGVEVLVQVGDGVEMLSVIHT